MSEQEFFIKNIDREVYLGAWIDSNNRTTYMATPIAGEAVIFSSYKEAEKILEMLNEYWKSSKILDIKVLIL